jgi:hypothetical protein
MIYAAIAVLMTLACLMPWVAAEQDYLPRNPFLSERNRRTERRAIALAGYIGCIFAFGAGILIGTVI